MRAKKKAGKRNGKAKRPAARKRDYEVITLRIKSGDKRRLVAHCEFRQKSEKQRYVSFNQAIIDLISTAPA